MVERLGKGENMPKMTISGLKSAMATYVDDAKQAGEWSATTANLAGLLDKIGKTVRLDGLFNDKLPELEGENLPLGKTIEEYMIDLTLPEAYSNITTEGAKDVVPALPSVEDVAYSYTLGREKIKTTIPYNNLERAFNSTEESASAIANISEKLQNSFDLTRYFTKKQLLGNLATKVFEAMGSGEPYASDASEVYKSIDLPTDATKAEALIQQWKDDVENASFAHEGGLAKALIGATPSLTLFVKKGVMSGVQVNALAGAFQKEELAIPATIKIVEDFGTITGGTSGKEVFAMMVDTRGVKLHNGYNATRTSPNADGDFMNVVRHFEDTGFISKYTYVKIYETK